MLEVPPYSWASIDKTVPTNQVTTIIFVGSNVSGYPGILHGGFLASLIDEVLARRAFPLLPSRVGATARLEINYERPAISGQLLMLKARSTRAEGREVWAEAEILALGDLKEKSGLSNVLVRADGLSMEPKNSAIVESIYKAV
ncbi:hypothetical protein H2201_008741 [Coniosporium apollinis]|uniref:Thioesterase domain-containing protein n=1 Tax=Coniosporium apollinis TaxID=61459 RepID=A0ABQ9NGA6_9PEZI|nr:hypothetical protein H2201_008741 [Coniosporium apollinis]